MASCIEALLDRCEQSEGGGHLRCVWVLCAHREQGAIGHFPGGRRPGGGRYWTNGWGGLPAWVTIRRCAMSRIVFNRI